MESLSDEEDREVNRQFRYRKVSTGSSNHHNGSSETFWSRGCLSKGLNVRKSAI